MPLSVSSILINTVILEPFYYRPSYNSITAITTAAILVVYVPTIGRPQFVIDYMTTLLLMVF